jgi:hypothetical protein
MPEGILLQVQFTLVARIPQGMADTGDVVDAGELLANPTHFDILLSTEIGESDRDSIRFDLPAFTLGEMVFGIPLHGRMGRRGVPVFGSTITRYDLPGLVVGVPALPGFPIDEIPISYVTNGIHVPSWISQDLVDLYDRYVGLKWREEPTSVEIWNRINNIPEEEIWRTHERRRERLVSFARKRLTGQLKRQGASDFELNLTRGVLNSKALTIGFARRFATYKRADLIFRDIERLSRILKNPDMPVQIIIAGNNPLCIPIPFNRIENRFPESEIVGIGIYRHSGSDSRSCNDSVGKKVYRL